jgi:hypothetical protein
VFVRDGIAGVCRWRVWSSACVAEDEDGGFGAYGVVHGHKSREKKLGVCRRSQSRRRRSRQACSCGGEAAGFSSNLEAVAAAVVSMTMESSRKSGDGECVVVARMQVKIRG